MLGAVLFAASVVLFLLAVVCYFKAMNEHKRETGS
jgi:hypothetical protein